MKNFILSAVLFTFLYGCTQLTEVQTYAVYPLIFQSEYTNNAWGYNHNGWMMDHSGTVKRFLKTAPWVFPDSAGYISEADMKKNLAACDSVLEYVSLEELSKFTAKALACANGPLTKASMTMADAGEHIQAFYLYEADKRRYKRVILSMTGDWSQENLAASTSEVVDWMKKIN